MLERFRVAGAHFSDKRKQFAMAHHPEGYVVDIVGIAVGNRGRKCEHHKICGLQLYKDAVVRFRTVQVQYRIKEEPAIAAYWVTDGVDRCRVGFLPKRYIKFKDNFDGKLAQVLTFARDSENAAIRQKSEDNCGICRAAIISADFDGTNIVFDDEEEMSNDNIRITFNKDSLNVPKSGHFTSAFSSETPPKKRKFSKYSDDSSDNDESETTRTPDFELLKPLKK